MNTYNRSFLFVIVLALTIASSRGAGAFGLAADNKIRAQSLVNKLMIDNPDLLTAGMHCVPPGKEAQAIIASTLNVIGKPSDPPDVGVGAQGETIISPNLKIPKLGIMLPLRDRAGHDIGALALAFKFPAGKDQVKCFIEATEIRDRLTQEISTLEDLFVIP